MFRSCFTVENNHYIPRMRVRPTVKMRPENRPLSCGGAEFFLGFLGVAVGDRGVTGASVAGGGGGGLESGAGLGLGCC